MGNNLCHSYSTFKITTQIRTTFNKYNVDVEEPLHAVANLTIFPGYENCI
jgi:hypothetical protein